MIFLYILFLLFSFGVLFWQASLLYVAIFSAPTVYAYDQAMEDAFQLAKLKAGEVVIDLGCGNARSLIIAAKKFKAKGVGVEISPYCYLKSKLNVFLAGESGNIKILFGDFKKAEKYLEDADVVYLYLLNSVLKKIEPWYFSKINRKTRTVVLSFQFSAHEAKKIAKTSNLGRETSISIY